MMETKSRGRAGLVGAAVVLALVCAAAYGTGAAETTTSSGAPVELELFSANALGAETKEEWYYTNPLGAKIEKLSGVKIKFQFPTGDGAEKLTLLLAGGTYPDLIYHQSEPLMKKMVDDKIAVPLEDLISKYGPEVKKLYGGLLDRLKWTDGTVYHLSNNFGETGKSGLPGLSGATYNFRGDLYRQLGSPQLKTLDDIYSLLVTLRSKYPTNADGQKAYPLGGFVQTWQDMIDTLIASAGGYNSKYYVDDSDKLSYWVRAPWALTIIKFYNRVSREGLLDPEAFTMDRGTWQKEKLGAEKMYSYFGNGWMGRSAEAIFKEKGRVDATMESYPFSVPGAQTPRLVGENPLGGGYTLITDRCRDGAAAMRWLNTLCQINLEVCNGIQGGIWDFIGGKPALKPEVVQRYLAGPVLDQVWAESTGFAMYKYVARTQGRTEWDTGFILKDDPYALGNTRLINRQKMLVGFTYDATYLAKVMQGADDALTQLGRVVDDKLRQTLFEAILADSESKCVEAFNKYASDLDRLGLKDLEAFWNKNYQKARGK